ncbi:MAG: serine/threonine protein kinase [Acidobacteria bacterium]|nr:serine/threonine protein kinase [Acidobacteriota bacterium]
MKAPRVAELFAELCDLAAAERERRLSEIGAADAALAGRLARLVALDAKPSGPLEQIRGEVAAAAERQLLGEVSGTPERLGPWRLHERLGAGGMGEVYRGERTDGGFQQQAAIKIVRAGMASESVIARFLVERQVLARLDHPAIARLLDGGVAPDGRPWFAMELVEGLPINTFADGRRQSVEDRLRLVIEIAEAVEFAHRSLVVHRDLKPSNILVTTTCEPKLLDFGLAKLLEPDADPGLTRTDVRALTPAYAAPEQVYGEPITTATDVYSLGVVLYELLTGELPGEGGTPSSGAPTEASPRAAIERPSQRVRRVTGDRDEGARRARRLAGDLDTIVLRALAREPARRYASASAFADDLRRHLEGRPVTARPDTRFYRFRKFVGRHRVSVAAAAVALVSLVAGLTAALVQAERARAAATQAEAEAERARREGERATRMKDFLISVFREASPVQRRRGEPLSIEELLDAAEARIDTELADEPLLQADLWDDLAETRASADALERAQVLIEKALAAKRGHLPPDDLSLVESLVNRGSIANLRKRPEEALAAFDEAARILVARGEADSEPAAALSINRVHALLLAERNEEAAVEAARAHFLVERWYPGSPDAAMQSHNAGMIAERLGRYEEARGHFERALDELEAVVGPDHALVRFPLVGLAELYENRLGDIAAALSFWERSAAIARLRFAEGTPMREKAESDLLRARGKLAAASATESPR